VIELDADVLFDFDKADLKPAATALLAKVADVLRDSGSAPARIEGHTDGKGNADYNQKLSERRAAAVKDWLVNEGRIAAARLSAKGLGMKQPIAPNVNKDGSDNPEGRAKNRRVEIRVQRS
jgi:outer membrane protein OmpA-like peptidoglycan-associated protein